MIPEKFRETDLKIAKKEWGSAFKHGITQRFFSPDSKETLDCLEARTFRVLE